MTTLAHFLFSVLGMAISNDLQKIFGPRKSDRMFVRQQLKKGQRYEILVEFIPEEKVKVPFVDFDMGYHRHIPTSIAIKAARDAIS